MAGRKGSADTQVMSGASGAIVVNDTTKKTFDCDMIVVLEDGTVISEIEVNGVASDVKATYITTPGTSLKKGAILTPEDGDYFSSVTMSTAGSLNLVKKNAI